MSANTSIADEQAKGPIDFGFTNDYMFRAILQKNTKVLKGLVCALLHLQPEDITSIAVTNPVELGDRVDAKSFILDVKVQINYHTLMNLEMQVVNLLNWEDRSLSYLCRSYDQLCRGQEYNAALPAIHVGFLNYSPFPGSTEFYAKYQLRNEKNGRVYSDKFNLRVIDLTQITNATEEDKRSQIYHWARLFKATTWEEIRMIAANNEYLSEASRALFVMNADEIAREQSLAREDYRRWQNTIERMRDEDAKIMEEQRMLLAEKEKALTETERAILEAEMALAKNERALAESEKALAEKDAEIARLKALLAEKEKE